MSAVTVPRAVLEKALEALEKARDTTHSDTLYAQFEVAITALRAALAEQEQKTVAWMITTKDNRHFIFRMNKPMINHGETLTPLCICREWQELKEWEINDGRDQLPTEDLCNWSFRQGVYFAEAKLKEKNNG